MWDGSRDWLADAQPFVFLGPASEVEFGEKLARAGVSLFGTKFR
jgi:hypothetical protein